MQDDDQGRFSGQLVGLMDRLGEVYQVDELAAKWTFTGREKLTVPEALEIKEELETIEELLRQLEEARQNARVALIDMEALGQYVEQGELDELDALRRQVQDLVEQMAAQQGLERTKRGYQLTPQAMRLFQGRLLEQIFSAPRSLPHRPPSGECDRRRGRRDGADAALRVWRLRGSHGYSRVTRQRDAQAGQ